MRWGSTVRHHVSFFFFLMEALEEKAISSALETCKPTSWKRYVDDNLEKVKTHPAADGPPQHHRHHCKLKIHKWRIDRTDNSFSGLKDTPHGQWHVRIRIYRKPTHTDQYLLWTSKHPTTHKLSVVRTLYERTTILTDPEDRAVEEKHIPEALKIYQYPQWAIEKGARQVKKKGTKQKVKEETQKLDGEQGNGDTTVFT